MPWIAPVAMAGASIIGGAMANSQSAGDRKAAQEAWAQSVKDYENIGIPSEEAQKLALEDFRQQGKLTPEMEEAINMGPSAYEGMSTDPAYKSSQLEALQSLKDIGSSGGMTLADRANLERTEGNINADQRGAREAILQRTRERGQMGSGLELAAQLDAQQQGSQQAHEAGLQTEADARARALQAISAGGSLAGGLRSQDFGEQSQIADAKDRIAAFNAQNSQAVQQRNIANRNTAQGYNLSEAQRIADQNTGQHNTQQQYNKSLPQQTFANQLTLAQGKANARAGQASNLQQNARDTSAIWTGIGSGVAKAGAAYGGYQASQQPTDNKMTTGFKSGDAKLYAKDDDELDR